MRGGGTLCGGCTTGGCDEVKRKESSELEGPSSGGDAAFSPPPPPLPLPAHAHEPHAATGRLPRFVRQGMGCSRLGFDVACYQTHSHMISKVAARPFFHPYA